jgi:hypothetical protein
VPTGAALAEITGDSATMAATSAAKANVFIVFTVLEKYTAIWLTRACRRVAVVPYGNCHLPRTRFEGTFAAARLRRSAMKAVVEYTYATVLQVN